MKNLVCLLCMTSLALLAACGANTLGADLERARFDLDSCSVTNTGPCDSAVSEADKVLAGDPNNPDASMLKSSALAAEGGFQILPLMSTMSDTGGTSSQTRFKNIRDGITSSVTSPDLLRDSVAALTGITAPVATNEFYMNFYFQMGFLQALEAFSRPTLLAQPVAGGAVDVTLITDADRIIVQDDFLVGDDNLITGGITATGNGGDLITAIRQNYCALYNLNAPAAGFTRELLQDMVSCQLITGFAGPFLSPAVTACTDFVFTDSTCI